MMNYAIIVAGGMGKRMNSDIPKQFLELDGKPILYYTIQAFLNFSSTIQIILVLPASEIKESNFVDQYFPNHQRIKMVAGGETRFHSVQQGLNTIEDEGIVFIHDGVRPFVRDVVLQQCLEQAQAKGNAIPCIEIKDSLRQVLEHGNIAVSRNEYRSVQTPQTFDIKAIKQSYQQLYQPHFTDDASVFEAAGHVINLIDGNEENMKITTPQDLEIAGIILRQFKLNYQS